MIPSHLSLLINLFDAKKMCKKCAITFAHLNFLVYLQPAKSMISIDILLNCNILAIKNF